MRKPRITLRSIRATALTQRRGLRTPINLRGAEARNGSDALTREAAVRLGLELVDLSLQRRRAPARADVPRLAETYRTMRVPG